MSARDPGLMFAASDALLTTPLIPVSPVMEPDPRTNITGTVIDSGSAVGDWMTMSAR